MRCFAWVAPCKFTVFFTRWWDHSQQHSFIIHDSYKSHYLMSQLCWFDLGICVWTEVNLVYQIHCDSENVIHQVNVGFIVQCGLKPHSFCLDTLYYCCTADTALSLDTLSYGYTVQVLSCVVLFQLQHDTHSDNIFVPLVWAFTEAFQIRP